MIRGRRTTVLQVIPELSAGGAEQGCVDVAAALAEAGCRALVACRGGTRLHELVRVGAEHVPMPVHAKNPLTIWSNARRLAALARAEGVDILHARSRAPAWSAFYAARWAAMPFVTTCHAPYPCQSAAKRAYNAVMARGERVIAISHYVARHAVEALGADPAAVRVVPRGIAVERFHPNAVSPERMIDLARRWRVPDGANIVLMPARLTRWKGHAVLIEALALLRRPDVCAVLVGDAQGRGKYVAELEALIAQRGLSGSVRLPGPCADMPAAYALASVVVAPSTEPEGFGRVPVEAQAMGKPIVAADHGGACETIERGETGWLVEPGDAAALAEGVRQALALTPRARAMLATRAMSRVAQHFTRETMAAQTLSVYGEVLGRAIPTPLSV
ncbi:MAG TPA: glycosyl transferase [Rhodospirillaceae bacterium]|jgi:glycosyltransferase involved in cell wall biosynthesis|nr:glycosyltransferase family 4 protein [Alphaproteobacteria bacterium]HBH26110.1 glycosyl transferase [Rhodospirillaceae bacterium]